MLALFSPRISASVPSMARATFQCAAMPRSSCIDLQRINPGPTMPRLTSLIALSIASTLTAVFAGGRRMRQTVDRVPLVQFQSDVF